MTKVIILGQEPEQKKKKSIEFVKQVDHGLDIVNPRYSPNQFENIELIAREWDDGGLLDLIFAYDNDRNEGYLFLGHFNDGVVE